LDCGFAADSEEANFTSRETSEDLAVLSIDDRLAIHELYATYNLAVDTAWLSSDINRGEEWVQLFTPDAIFEGRESMTGHEGLRRFSERRPAILAAQAFYDEQHWNSNIVLREKEGFVEGFCYLLQLAKDRKTDVIEIDMSGCYHDRIVKTAEGWRFARRNLYLSMEALVSAVAAEPW
jgi:hypothetical protein